MMVTFIALVVLLICVLFIKSTIIIDSYNSYGTGVSQTDVRPTKINVTLLAICIISVFIPYVKWVTLIASPILTLVWFCSDGFREEYSKTKIKISDTTLMGKILSFKI